MPVWRGNRQLGFRQKAFIHFTYRIFFAGASIGTGASVAGDVNETGVFPVG